MATYPGAQLEIRIGDKSAVEGDFRMRVYLIMIGGSLHPMPNVDQESMIPAFIPGGNYTDPETTKEMILQTGETFDNWRSRLAYTEPMHHGPQPPQSQKPITPASSLRIYRNAGPKDPYIRAFPPSDGRYVKLQFKPKYVASFIDDGNECIVFLDSYAAILELKQKTTTLSLPMEQATEVNVSGRLGSIIDKTDGIANRLNSLINTVDRASARTSTIESQITHMRDHFVSLANEVNALIRRFEEQSEKPKRPSRPKKKKEGQATMPPFPPPPPTGPGTLGRGYGR